MRVSRQSKLAVAASSARRRPGGGAFTLIELIVVLALLAIAATFVASSMGSFFRGRMLNFEARRLLSLTHYAQSRAVSEGVPVVLWVNPTDSTYGLTVQSSFNNPEGDTRAISYTAESSLRLETPQGEVTPISEQDDEKLGLPSDGMSFIRFTPDGFFDDSSVSKITVRQGITGIELVPTANRLAFELRPASDAN
jgi:type II secretion system protein H